MKYRSGIELDPAFPEDANIHVKTLAGHCAIVGPDWRELPPTLHAAALVAGCEVDSSRTQATAPELKASPKAISQADEVGLITAALKEMLKRNDPAEFTVDGIPKVPAVSKQAGFTATKGDVLAAWAALTAEAQQ